MRVVSESGRAVALMDPLPDGWDPFVPLPRATTTIVVADPTGATAPRTFELVGNYEPEAFSAADDALFLIQHLPAETPQAYRVTMLDLDRGRVQPVFGPFKGPAERMPGIRLQQVLSPTATQLYTLYSSATPGYVPHGAPGPEGAIVSFVHVLSLEDGWAHCVGLPESMWDRPSAEQAMAPTPDGRYLFVVDAGLGEIAVLHTGTLRVRTAEVDLGLSGEVERTTAQMSADGRTLFVATAGSNGSTVTAVDVGSVRGRRPLERGRSHLEPRALVRRRAPVRRDRRRARRARCRERRGGRRRPRRRSRHRHAGPGDRRVDRPARRSPQRPGDDPQRRRASPRPGP